MIKENRGMTLVELLIVMFIISVLSVYLVPKLGNVTKGSQINAVETDLRVIKNSIQQYYIDNRGSVIDENGIKEYVDFEFVKISTDTDPVLKLKSVYKKDPWNMPYYIHIEKSGSEAVALFSFGPNQTKEVNGTTFGDDIVLLFYPRNY